MVKNFEGSLIQKHEIDIGMFYFYENFVVGEVNEGSDLNFESGKKLYQLIETYYKGTIPYTYISNRVNSYSFKPTRIHGSSEKFPNLKGYAIVTYDPVNHKIACLEKTFADIPTDVFNSLEDAITWSKKMTTVN
ncbi:hypothetical protein [Aquimarina mytili]|uniref:STAS/SEC14 domain-containing protein n=1 Tax=Aquimarina mytili TaxID=874423 RepID=A0A937A162_9FLAO|nr:hypothetical protein [Aquimarina mytili]MBL0684961.1 hypothetical protein [Aquimarina mytili]